jgi:hypothetical protein
LLRANPISEAIALIENDAIVLVYFAALREVVVCGMKRMARLKQGFLS